MIKSSQFPRILGWTLFSCLAGLCLSLVAAKLMAPDLWWVGTTATVLMCYAIRAWVVLPNRRLAQISDERLMLNLQIAGVRDSIWWKVWYQTRLWVALGLIFVPTLVLYKSNIIRGLVWTAELFRFEQPYVRVEFPAYVTKPPVEGLINGQNVDVSPGCYVEFSIAHLKNADNWKVVVSEGEKSHTLLFNLQGRNSHSIASLLEKMQLDATQTHTLNVDVQKRDKSSAQMTFNVFPVPAPKVTLTSQGLMQTENLKPEEVGSLRFSVGVNSEVPLQGIDLQVHTDSGFRRNKTVAEYANDSELEITVNDIELMIADIPFRQREKLYVKAVARTVVPNLVGQSQELVFEFLSQELTNQQLSEALNKALEAFKDKDLNEPAARDAIIAQLNAAKEAAQGLGLRNPVKRRLNEAMNHTQSMQNRQDSQGKQAQQKIQSMLQALKRDKNSQELASLMSRLQNLKSSIKQASEDGLPELQKDVKSMNQFAQELKGQLNQLLGSNDSGLTLEEKQNANRLMQLDQTPEKIDRIEPELKGKQRLMANQATDEAIAEMQKHMGAAAQMLMGARQRSIRDAREKLSKADGNLENARRGEKQSQREKLNEAQKALEQTPKLGQEFDNAVKDAREQAGQAKKQAEMRNGNPNAMEGHIEQSQQGIVKALQALQDEEEAERNRQNELEEDLQNKGETITGPGQVDESWRRQILGEIARRRAAGESSDSPRLKYLESRLR